MSVSFTVGTTFNIEIWGKVNLFSRLVLRSSSTHFGDQWTLSLHDSRLWNRSHFVDIVWKNEVAWSSLSATGLVLAHHLLSFLVSLAVKCTELIYFLCDQETCCKTTPHSSQLVCSASQKCLSLPCHLWMLIKHKMHSVLAFLEFSESQEN